MCGHREAGIMELLLELQVDCALFHPREWHSHHSQWNGALIAGWYTTSKAMQGAQAILWIVFCFVYCG